jgi:hypothetical protein
MKQRTIILSTLLFVATSLAQEKYSVDGDSGQIQTYYLSPNPKVIPTLMRSIDKSGILFKNKDAQFPLIGFFTMAMAITQSDSSLFQETIAQLGDSKPFFEYCVNLSRNPNYILELQDHSPSINDMYWGAFFATGNKRYILKLVSELSLCEEDSLYLYLTGGSAKWALSSNFRQHQLIRKIIVAMGMPSNPKIAHHLLEAVQKEPAKIREELIEGVRKREHKN